MSACVCVCVCVCLCGGETAIFPGIPIIRGRVCRRFEKTVQNLSPRNGWAIKERDFNNKLL